MDRADRRWVLHSYWWSREVAGVTAEADKVGPVYKLEEIRELICAPTLAS
jgi:hypothetical protein